MYVNDQCLFTGSFMLVNVLKSKINLGQPNVTQAIIFLMLSWE